MNLRFTILALAFTCAATAASAFEEGEVWQGAYHYPNAPSVQFVFFVTGATSTDFEGFVVENNTLGNPDVPMLYATVSGTVTGNSVRWAKTYDGTGGVSHTVNYSGAIADGGFERQINGRWTTGGAAGDFEMDLRIR